MKVRPVDVKGAIYSGKGLRFGGFTTAEFLELTERLEFVRPGAREEVIAEAHYLLYWLHRFPEIVFILTLAGSRSLLLSSAGFIGAYLIEYIRFYTFGPSRLLSLMCRGWEVVRIPLCIGVAVFLWSDSPKLSIALLAFLILQVWLNVISTIVLFPVRALLTYSVHSLFGARDRHVHNIEGLALKWVIDRWNQTTLPMASTHGSG